MFFLSAQDIRRAAADLGLTQIGIIPADPSPTLDAYRAWIAAEMHGTMGYMARPDRVARREDLNVILPGVRSLVIAALDYHTGAVPEHILSDPRRGRFSSYAWGADYHDMLTSRLQQLTAVIREESGGETADRVYVDAGPIMERSHAQAAGLGFVGKNTMLIHPRRGSYFFLGEILTTAAFDEVDQPGRATMCGTCTRCQTACPTNAFPRPYVLDARRCISYLTIELKGAIPEDLRPLFGNWVYGCDICQQVCPFTRFTQPSGEQAFWPTTIYRAAPPLHDLLALDEGTFHEQFAGSAVERIGRDRLVRNACIAAGNSGLIEFAPVLERLAQYDQSELVREHAQWGLEKVVGL